MIGGSTRRAAGARERRGTGIVVEPQSPASRSSRTKSSSPASRSANGSGLGRGRDRLTAWQPETSATGLPWASPVLGEPGPCDCVGGRGVQRCHEWIFPATACARCDSRHLSDAKLPDFVGLWCADVSNSARTRSDSTSTPCRARLPGEMKNRAPRARRLLQKRALWRSSQRYWVSRRSSAPDQSSRVQLADAVDRADQGHGIGLISQRPGSVSCT